MAQTMIAYFESRRSTILVTYSTLGLQWVATHGLLKAMDAYAGYEKWHKHESIWVLSSAKADNTFQKRLCVRVSDRVRFPGGVISAP